MGQASKEVERTVGAKLVYFIKWKTVARGSGKSSELQGARRGKKGHGNSGRFSGKCANPKVNIEAVERLVEPEDEAVSFWYILKYSTRGGSNIFQLFDRSEKKDQPFRGKQKALVGVSRKEGSPPRKLAKRVARHQVSRSNGKSPSVSLTEALSDTTNVAKLVVDRWFVDKGFGFGKVHTDEIVFIHAGAVGGAEVLTIGTDAWVQAVNDYARVQGGYRARRAWGRAAWNEEKNKERANKIAQQVRRAAALTQRSSVGEGLRGVRPPSWFARRASCCTRASRQQRAAQPILLD